MEGDKQYIELLVSGMHYKKQNLKYLVLILKSFYMLKINHPLFH